MKPTKTKERAREAGALALSTAPAAKASDVHALGNGFVCETDTRGYTTPRGRSPLDIVVDASEGFIPLWERDTTLRWRFDERSMRAFTSPSSAKKALRALFAEAILAWGDAAPVRFAENNDAWDFEISMRRADNCDAQGCTLASAFFPDAGRHQLFLYPKLLEQKQKEQVDTLVHELGHTFGLRHFFANVSEGAWPSEIFGSHKRFSIMNYGALSQLTDEDKSDLKNLYQLAWSGELKHINRTPIRLVRPYHTTGLG